MPSVHLSKHPLILDRLAQLRDQSTPPPLFRTLIHNLSVMLFTEAATDLTLTPTTVITPLAPAGAQRLNERIGLFPILRAGLGMAQAILDLVPEAQVWHLGLYRDHATLEPVTYYHNLIGQPSLGRAFLLDPMLATGGSAVAASTILKEWGVAHITFVGIIGAPEGIEKLQGAHPEVAIHLAAIDSQLNEVGYIVPGLGDAGDRLFGT